MDNFVSNDAQDPAVVRHMLLRKKVCLLTTYSSRLQN